MQHLRSHIGVVSQEPVLFEGSISENIKLGNVDATEEEIIEAAKVANAHHFVQELPEVFLESQSTIYRHKSFFIFDTGTLEHWNTYHLSYRKLC